MSGLLAQDVLRELGQKKPQLDELVHTAEALRADTNRQQVHGKGKLILFSPISTRFSFQKLLFRVSI